MRIKSKLGMDNKVYTDSIGRNFHIPYFHAKFEPEVIPIQDHIHIGAKLGVRLLKYSNMLPTGNFF